MDQEVTGTSEVLVTRRELAALLGVHMQTVTDWERSGLPIAQRGRKGKPSLYRESEARAWLAAREEAAKQPGGAVDAAQARAQKEHWQALLAQQMHEVRAKKLLPAEDVAKAWSAEVSAVRAIILGTYTTLADKVHRAATLEGVVGVERVMKEIAYDVLRELAQPDRPVTPTGQTKRGKAA